MMNIRTNINLWYFVGANGTGKSSFAYVFEYLFTGKEIPMYYIDYTIK